MTPLGSASGLDVLELSASPEKIGAEHRRLFKDGIYAAVWGLRVGFRTHGDLPVVRTIGQLKGDRLNADPLIAFP